jgi:hypothetical protein
VTVVTADQTHHQVLLPWKLPPIVADFIERAGWSAGQVFFATLLAGGTSVSVANLPWKYALVLAVSAAVGSAVLTALQYIARMTDLPFWEDLLARLGKTFLASLLASFAAAHPFDIIAFDWPTALNVAALAVLAALGKGLLARGSDVGLAAGPATATATVTGTNAVPNPSTLPTATYIEAVSGHSLGALHP